MSWRALVHLSEKDTQAQIVAVLKTINAAVFVLGRPARRDDVHKGTRQTAGMSDLCVFLPASRTGHPPHVLFVEVKAARGRLSPAQVVFREWCEHTGTPYLTGGVDVVLGYLAERGYVSELPHYRQRTRSA